MVIPTFHFTSYVNSFKVNVKNLEQLSVEQIQAIESFVKNRKGIFDFTTYTFSIQKKLEFYEFEKLVKTSEITAICVNNPTIVKQQARVSFGQYKGMFYSELPDSYLLWLLGNYAGKDKQIIVDEARKRKLSS